MNNYSPKNKDIIWHSFLGEIQIQYFVFQLFKGVFYHCEGPDAEIVKNKTQCLELSGNGNRWVNHKYNFDNLGQALMSLFVLSSKDGWVNIMYSGLDAVGIDQQVLLLVVLIFFMYPNFFDKFICSSILSIFVNISAATEFQ